MVMIWVMLGLSIAILGAVARSLICLAGRSTESLGRIQTSRQSPISKQELRVFGFNPRSWETPGPAR